VSLAALPDDDLTPLVDLLAGRRFVALTGAGCSTESGIPDYRGGGRTGPRNPIQHDAFMRRADVRRRYWARAALGWERFSGAEPNAAHRALAALEQAGLVQAVVTQNIDTLHDRAGSADVIEVHGSIRQAVCLPCGAGEPLAGVLEQLETAAVPRCRACGAIPKPDVVLFGELLPVAAMARAEQLARRAALLLVVGSSLQVWPVAGLPEETLAAGGTLAVLNREPTPYDDRARTVVTGPAGATLHEVARLLVDRP
jgi:NAD-dependent deacetylase